MLHRYERKLLFHLARHTYSGWGRIIDGGCFLGGSTLALGHGLMGRQDASRLHKQIHTFDLFEVTPIMLADPPTRELLQDVDTSEKFRARFDEITAPISDFVELHHGDITSFDWKKADPIEICFIDVSKTLEIEEWIVSKFYPSFRPGTILIHQDFFDKWSPQIPVTMGLLERYFLPVTTLEWSTAIYICKEEIPPGVLPAGFTRSISLEDAFASIDRAAVGYNPMQKQLMNLQKASFALVRGDKDRALSLIDHYVGDAAMFPRAQWVADQVRSAILG